ncbi:MAG TPA: HNH endonuclease [Spirochaetia bacterium]|nr:HNH endonuclease [Spirochaetia bacterium]
MTEFTPEWIEEARERIREHFQYEINKNTGCWEWTKSTSKGYGHLGIRGKFYQAHRLMWIITNGEIKDGLFVCHKCDNRLCINPDHLFLGTNLDNINDAIEKGKWQHQPKGEKNGNAKLTKNQVLNIKHLVSNGIPTKTISEKFNISQRHVQYIAKNKTWKHLINGVG